jgi:hypothetical protein
VPLRGEYQRLGNVVFGTDADIRVHAPPAPPRLATQFGFAGEMEMDQ